MEFVIIGGDAAGMSAASRIKRNDPTIHATVFEQSGDVSYSACGMPYNIADETRAVDDLVVRSAEDFRKKHGVDLHTGHRVERIDRQGKTISGTDANGAKFSRSYDKLLIATGGSPNMPSLPGFDLPGVMVLKNLDDARKLKTYLADHPVRKAVIIGMGYIGLEMAEALRERKISVEMVKNRGGFLPWMHPDLSAVVHEEISMQGVMTNPGCTAGSITRTPDGELAVHCPNQSFTGDLVLVAIGIHPNSGIAKEAGLELGPAGAILVNRHCQTSDPSIYAAGDCATAPHKITGQPAWIPLALIANRGGWTVADHACGIPSALDGILGTAVFKVFGLEVARTGFTMEEARAAGFTPVDVVIKTRSRAHAHPGASRIWVHMVADQPTGKLLGAFMVGREGVAHRINTAAVALQAGMTVQSFHQSDLAYAPPFGPLWDPLLTAANQLMKKL